jgi:hypothetical protein
MVGMADEVSADTFEYTLAGREMVFKKTERSQLMMLQRIVRRIEQQMHGVADKPEQVSALATQLSDVAFEAVESRFTDPADLHFVTTHILRGVIVEDDLWAILSNGRKANEAPDDDADPAPAKKAAKKATKKAASPRRGAR